MTVKAPRRESQAPEPRDILAKGISGPRSLDEATPACQRINITSILDSQAEVAVLQRLSFRKEENTEAVTKAAMPKSGTEPTAAKKDKPAGGDILVVLTTRKGRKVRARMISSDPAMTTLSRSGEKRSFSATSLFIPRFRHCCL
jgi:hypothetical protein